MHTFHVSPQGSDHAEGTAQAPFATLERARDAVRAVNSAMSGDIVVVLHGGRYERSGPLELDARDGGTQGHRVVWRAQRGETPLLSGGRALTGWTEGKNGVWQASARGLRFRQLWVNETRAVRARTPNLGAADGDHVRFAPYDMEGRTLRIEGAQAARLDGGPEVLSGAQLVLQTHFIAGILPLKSVEKSDGELRLTLADASEARFFPWLETHRAHLPPYAPVGHFEGRREFLDAPGEWFLDTASDTVFYRPRNGEEMNRLEAVVPVVETLLSIKGTPETPVRDVSFEGVSFSHTTWLKPDDGYFPGQALQRTSHEPRLSGAIEVSEAQGVRLERNRVQHSGGNGISLLPQTRECVVVGNLVRDVAGNGIEVVSFKPDRLSYGDEISHNTVTEVGRDYYAAVGIVVGYADGIRIEHNLIFDAPYTGLSVGWGWTRRNQVARNNMVRWNHIFNVTNLLDDGAGIYTLGNQPGSLVEGNLIHDMRRSPGMKSARPMPIAGIYLDEGSDEFAVRGNLIENVEKPLNRNKNGPNIVVDDDETPNLAIYTQAGPQLPYRWLDVEARLRGALD